MVAVDMGNPDAPIGLPLPLTPAQIEGPYFRLGAPRRESLLEPGMSGERLVLSGRVLVPEGKPVPGGERFSQSFVVAGQSSESTEPAECPLLYLGCAKRTDSFRPAPAVPLCANRRHPPNSFSPPAPSWCLSLLIRSHILSTH